MIRNVIRLTHTQTHIRNRYNRIEYNTARVNVQVRKEKKTGKKTRQTQVIYSSLAMCTKEKTMKMKMKTRRRPRRRRYYQKTFFFVLMKKENTRIYPHKTTTKKKIKQEEDITTNNNLKAPKRENERTREYIYIYTYICKRIYRHYKQQ